MISEPGSVCFVPLGLSPVVSPHSSTQTVAQLSSPRDQSQLTAQPGSFFLNFSQAEIH